MGKKNSKIAKVTFVLLVITNSCQIYLCFEGIVSIPSCKQGLIFTGEGEVTVPYFRLHQGVGIKGHVILSCFVNLF